MLSNQLLSPDFNNVQAVFSKSLEVTVIYHLGYLLCYIQGILYFASIPTHITVCLAVGLIFHKQLKIAMFTSIFWLNNITLNCLISLLNIGVFQGEMAHFMSRLLK